MSAARASSRPENGANEDVERLDKLCLDFSRAIAILRSLPDNDGASIIADFVTDTFPDLIEHATGAENAAGHWYGEKTLIAQRNGMLVRADQGFASVREFREAFHYYHTHDWKRDRLQPDAPNEYPQHWFYRALILIDEVPADSTLSPILRKNRVWP